MADGEQQIKYNISKTPQQRLPIQPVVQGYPGQQCEAGLRTYIRSSRSSNTEAFQSNHNLLLTRDAKITTLPQLEIYADDVKCSQGHYQSFGRTGFLLSAVRVFPEEAQLLQQMALFMTCWSMYAAKPYVQGCKRWLKADCVENFQNVHIAPCIVVKILCISFRNSLLILPRLVSCNSIFAHRLYILLNFLNVV